MAEIAFTDPDLARFLGVDGLGLTVTGLRMSPDEALLECRLRALEEGAFCRVFGARGAAVVTGARCLAFVLVGRRPSDLLVRLWRRRFQGWGRVS